jgi:hypothetical protein
VVVSALAALLTPSAALAQTGGGEHAGDQSETGGGARATAPAGPDTGDSPDTFDPDAAGWPQSPGPDPGTETAQGPTKSEAAPAAPVNAPAGGPAVDPASREALFDTTLGDAEVDLFIVGSWNTGIGGTLGWAFHPEIPPEDNRVTFPYEFPGMEPTPYFNAVDLTLSLWLYERYYLEASFLDEFEVNSFILGYQGREEEFVQSVRIGYGMLSMSEYPYIPFSEATESAPGAQAAFTTQRSDHELLVRYEPSEEQRKVFYGLNEATEKRIDPADYITGRFFVLPDDKVEDLTLYIEDAEGTVSAAGSTWREAQLDAEAVYSAEEGFIYLREPARARVAVHYTKGGSAVGTDDGPGGLGADALVGVDDGGTPANPTDDVLDPAAGPYDFSFAADPYGGGTYLGVDLSSLELTLAGNQSLLLYEPGAVNPFEIQNRYDISELSSAQDLDTELVRRGEYSQRELENRVLSVNEEQTVIAVIDADRGPRHHANRYPFAGEFPLLYGANPTDKDGYTDFEILATGLSPVTQLTIDGNVVPGSVTVLRNGVEDPSFEVNYESGEITSPFPIYPNDVIEVVYRVYGAGGGGDLLLATGNRISLGPQTDLTLALGSRWNVLRGAYSVSPTDHPGSVTASAAVEHETDYFSGYLDGAVQLSVPDTTGFLRLLGMEGKQTVIPAADGSLFPAAAPAAAGAEGSDPDRTWDDALTQTNRGRLFYKDFYDDTAFGGRVLREYDWDPPDDQVYPYEAGSRIGPYPARADDDGIDGQIMVLDFDMDSEERWVGGHLRMPDFTTRDFSEITEVTFSWRTLGVSVDGPSADDIEVYVQLGALAEDLDGDGELDEGESPLSPSFEFTDQTAGFAVKAGRPPPGENYRMSEDGNRNGVLDTENPELVHTLSETGTANLVAAAGRPDESWRTVSFDLDASARRRLAATRAVRVVVVTDDGESASGRVLVSQLTFRGTTFQTEVSSADPSATVTAREVPDSGAPRKLTKEHDEVKEVFHSEGTGNQRVLQIDWSDLSGSGDFWALTDYVTPVPARQYEVLAFYLRVSDLGGETSADDGRGELSVSLSEEKPNGGGDGVSARIPIDEADADWAGGRWRKVELDSASGDVLVDGEPVGSLEKRPASGSERLSFLQVAFAPEDGAAEGTLYVDEVHWAETRLSVSGASRLSATYTYPETVLEAGEVEILSNVRVSQDTSVRSGGFATDSAVTGGTGSFLTRTELAGDLLYTRLETDVQVAVQDEQTAVSGGHSLRVPAVDAPVVFIESFRRNYNAPFVSLYRSNALLLSLPLETAVRIDSDATLREDNLEQSWELEGSIEPAERLRFESSAGLGHSAAGYDPGSPSYPESWITSYELLAPFERGETPVRSGIASLTAELEPAPVGLRGENSQSYENRSSTEREQTNEAALRLALPLAFRPESPTSWTLTPSYGRAFERTVSAPAADSYADDLDAYAGAFSGQRYLAASIPVVELFQSAEDIGFAEHSDGEPYTSYTPDVALTLTRSFGSRLRDLVLPSEAELGTERSFTREAEAVTELQSFRASYTATAVNLFGRSGAYPTFEIYRTDEFSNSLSATVDRSFPAEETTVSGEVSQRTALFGAEGNELRLTNTASGTFADTRSLSVESETAYLWRSPAELVSSFELLIEDEDPYFAHTERALFLYDRPGGEDEVQSYSITFGHETRLVFPGHGFLRLYADLGVGLQPAVIDAEEVNVVLLGVQGGIEGKIEF